MAFQDPIWTLLSGLNMSQPLWQQMQGVQSAGSAGMSYTPAPPPPPPAPSPQSAGMSFTPSLPPQPNITQFDLMMRDAHQPAFDYAQWAQGAGNTPDGRNSVAGGYSVMPPAPTSGGEIGFAPGANAGEYGASMPGGDPINIDPSQYNQPGRSSAMDYVGKLQELANAKDPSMGRDKRRALSDALAIFGAKMIGDKPTTTAGKIFGAVAPAIVGFNAAEAATDERKRKEKASQADDLLKALQLQNTDAYRQDSLDLKEKLGLMAADNRNTMADIKLALGQGNLDARKEEIAQRRNIAADNLRFKREKLDSDIKNDAETLKIRQAEAAAKGHATPFDRQMAVDKAANDYWKTLGLDRPDNFFGEDYNATKELHKRYVDGLQKWLLTDPTQPAQTPQTAPGTAQGRRAPTVSVGSTAIGPGGARLRWDGTAWQPA